MQQTHTSIVKRNACAHMVAKQACATKLGNIQAPAVNRLSPSHHTTMTDGGALCKQAAVILSNRLHMYECGPRACPWGRITHLNHSAVEGLQHQLLSAACSLQQQPGIHSVLHCICEYDTCKARVLTFSTVGDQFLWIGTGVECCSSIFAP
jgi:hypothetical protein